MNGRLYTSIPREVLFLPDSQPHGGSEKDLCSQGIILEDALPVSMNLGKHSLVFWLYISGVNTGKRRTIRLDELSSVVRRLSRTTEDSASFSIKKANA